MDFNAYSVCNSLAGLLDENVARSHVYLAADLFEVHLEAEDLVAQVDADGGVARFVVDLSGNNRLIHSPMNMVMALSTHSHNH